MAKTPIEMMMDGVQWVAVDAPDDKDGLPYATHEGELELLGVKLAVYRLSNGQAIIAADSIAELFEALH